MADDEPVPEPPEGYLRQKGRGPFSAHNGPYFYKPTPEGMRHAFYALRRHANGLGLVHGGMLTAFLDGMMAAAAAQAAGKAGITVHLSVDFLHMARAGEWVMGEARVTRAARDLAFVDGRCFVGERDVVRASGVFKLMRRDRQA